MANNYYPFGLTFNSYQRVTAKENKYNTFQDQEKITALDLNWIQFKWRNHDPTIGRFFNVDPLAEFYYFNSPYAFAENRVIDGRELEGLEWESIHSEDKKTTVNVVTVKVRNISSMSDADAMALVSDIITQTQESFSGTDADGNTTITVVTADFESEIEEGDFYMELRDDIEMVDGSTSVHPNGRTEEIGDTQSNRVQINAGKAMDERDRDGVVRSGAHEVGHTAGLTHPNPTSSQAGTDDNGNKLNKENLMVQGGNGTEVTQEQLRDVNEKVKGQQ